jgi:hypothetical protein
MYWTLTFLATFENGVLRLIFIQYSTPLSNKGLDHCIENANGDGNERMGYKMNTPAIPRGTKFGKILSSNLSLQVPFTNVNEYPKLIKSRSDERGWGIDSRSLDNLTEKLQNLDNTDPLEPVSVDIWIKGNGTLQHDWDEAVQWLEDEAFKMGVVFRNEISSDYHQLLDLYPHQSQFGTRNRLTVVGLNFNNPTHQMAVTARKRDRNWPGLALLWFFCLNPQTISLIGDNIPNLLILGLVMQSNGTIHEVPYLHMLGETLVLGSQTDDLYTDDKTAYASFRNLLVDKKSKVQCTNRSFSFN